MVPSSAEAPTKIREVLLAHTTSADLRRLDSDAATLQATYLIGCESDESLYAVMQALQQALPGCECSFVEQDNTLGA